MFMVTGALLAQSFTKGDIRGTFYKRFKRLLPPMWVYGFIVYFASWHYSTDVSPRWTFLLPLDQPSSEIAGGWFTSALWYLRAYVWVLLLSPLLFICTKRWKLATPLIGISLVLIVGWQELDSSEFGWAVGDIILYATCTAIGMAWLTGNRPSRRSLSTVALISFTAAALWLTYRQPQNDVVNNDHALHLFIGIFWAAVLLQFPRTLSRFATTPISRFLNRYPLSIYLWHSMIAWTAWQLIPQFNSEIVRTFLIVLVTFSALPIVIYVVGLVEKREHNWRRIRHIAPRLALTALVIAGLNFGPISTNLNFVRARADQPLPPSAAPTKIEIEVSAETQQFLDSQRSEASQWREQELQLQRVIDSFSQRMNLPGVRAVVISKTGKTWLGTTGDTKPFSQPSLIGSITKTFTTSLTMKLVERGIISLDDEIGDLGINFAHAKIKVRQILTHTSGLPDFQAQSGSVEDNVTPFDVARYVSERPLLSPPGSFVSYSNVGFVVLGLFLEEKTGQTYEKLLRSEIIDPLGYKISTFRGRYGSVGYSSGGISMKMIDLADWARRYFYDRNTTSQKWKWSIKETTGVGVHGYCPCTGQSFIALGHIGGRTFVSVDGEGTVVVIDTPGVLVLSNYATTHAFAQELRLVAGGGKEFLYR
jgi:CubicO group peptidase (beta-lactamase class C family)/peptidoglycan/LPS O-acetylase OafA/YrhL